MNKQIVQIIVVLAVLFSGSSVLGFTDLGNLQLSASAIYSNDTQIKSSLNMHKDTYVACIPLSLEEVSDKIIYSSSNPPLRDRLDRDYYQARFEHFQLAYLTIHNTSTGLSDYNYRMKNWPDKSSITAEARGSTNLSVSAARDQMSLSIDASARPTTDYDGYPKVQDENGRRSAYSYSQFQGWGPSTLSMNGEDYAEILENIDQNNYIPIQRNLDVKIGDEGIGLIEGATAGGLVYYIRCKNMTREQYENPERITEVFEDKPLSFFGL